MKFITRTSPARLIIATAIAILTLVGLTACESIYDDDLQPCPQGLRLRFIYDYTLEGGNSFPSQVDCLTLHIYDAEGKYVRTLTETFDALRDENYRMTVDLPAGEYRLIAYGGAECDEASFSHTAYPHEGSLDEEIGMKLNDECLQPGNPKGRLHDHFYGSVKVSVTNPVDYTEETVPMMKNTNHFRIMLQHLNYEPLDGNDYDFEIIDDNTLFDHRNMLVDNGDVTYTPWSKGTVGTGVVEQRPDGTRTITEVVSAYAELSTSRLMTSRHPRLIVRHIASGNVCIDIPLINYLKALRSDRFSQYKDQEFLDRQSNWNMIFFMNDAQTWYKSHIKVNDWDVRINNIEK